MAVINARPNPVEVNIDGETNRFSIAVDRKTFHLLIDKLYTNKVRAVIRELWTNALDSHTAAGHPERPFDVQLPNVLDGTFKVRDYGTSMDHDTIMKLYTTIGYSSSEGSNDFIGAMGLGSKSPFAYTDHFTVIAWLNGEKRIYTAYYEADGVPAIKHIVTMPSDEEQGIEVSFAAKPADFKEFEREAQYLAIGFDVPPNGLDCAVAEPIFQYKNWKVYGDSHFGNFSIRMGSVIYPVNNTQIDMTYLVSNFHSLVYTVPIGSVDVAASREALSLDKHTEAFIRQVHDQVRQEIGEYIGLQFQDCKTLLDWERKHLDFNSAVFRRPSIPFLNGDRVVKKALNGYITFDPYGHTFSGNRGKDPEVHAWPGLSAKANEKGEIITHFWVNRLDHYKFIIIRSQEKMLRKNMRLKAFFRDADSSFVLTLTDPTPQQLERLVRRLDLRPDQIMSMHDLPDVQVVAPVKGANKGAKGIYVLKHNRGWHDNEYMTQPPVVDLTTNYKWLMIDKRTTNGRVIGSPIYAHFLVQKMSTWWSWNARLEDLGCKVEYDNVYIFTETAHRRVKPEDDRRFDHAVWNAILGLPDLEGALQYGMFRDVNRYNYRAQTQEIMQAIFGITEDDIQLDKKYHGLLCTMGLRERLIQHFGLKPPVEASKVREQYPLLFGEAPQEHMLEYIEWRKAALAQTNDND